MTDSPPLPETVGGYAVERELGEGGMGRVYLGRHEGLDRLVALKVLQPKLAGEQEFVDRFMREARAAAKFAHPNVVTVFDTGVDQNGVHFIAFEYVDGGTAEDLLRAQGKVDEARVVTIALGVAEALAFADSQGIVHRDVKPENILLTPDGVPKLADLGLAKQVENEQSNLTQTGMVLGTPLYMSPEQALGDPLDIRSDVYSLGLCMWRMLTGLIPFDEDRSASSLQIINRHINQDLPNVRERVPEVSADLAYVIERMAAREAADRYPDAKELVKDLRRLHTGAPLVESAAPQRGASTRLPLTDSNPAHRSGPTGPLTTRAAPAQSRAPSSTPPVLSMDQVVIRPRETGSNAVLPFVLVLLAVAGAVGYGVYLRVDRPPEPPPPAVVPPPANDPQPAADPKVEPLPEFDASVDTRARIGRLATELRGSLANLGRARLLSAALREQIARFYEEEEEQGLDETQALIVGAFEQLLDASEDFADEGPSVEAIFAGSVNRDVRARDDAARIEEACKAISQVTYGLDPVSSGRLERGLISAAEAYDRDAVEALFTGLPAPRADALGRLQELARDVAVAYVLRGYARSCLVAERPDPAPTWLSDPRPELRGEELFAILEVAQSLSAPGGLTPEERERYRQRVDRAHLALKSSLLGTLARPSIAPVIGFLQVVYPDNTPIAAALAFAAAVEHGGQTPRWLHTTRPLRDGARNRFLGGGAVVIFLPKPPSGSQTLTVRLSDDTGKVTEAWEFEAHRYSVQGLGGHAVIDRWPSPAWVTLRVHNAEAGVTISQGLGTRAPFATAARLPRALAVEWAGVEGAMPFKAYAVDGLALPPPTWPGDLPEHPADAPQPQQPRQPVKNQTGTHPTLKTPDGRPVPVDGQGRPLGPDGQPLATDANGAPIFPPPPSGGQGGQQPPPPGGQGGQQPP
ncbi:MAG: protein kinase, partial [Planctomycetes bacterium]|nr:protein kinase [Planctomycetota bacterium]